MLVFPSKDVFIIPSRQLKGFPERIRSGTVVVESGRDAIKGRFTLESKSENGRNPSKCLTSF